MPKAKRSTKVQFTNETPYTLTKCGSKLKHGIWTKNHEAPQKIKSGTTVEWMAESKGLMTGTEGEVQYMVDGNKLKVHWNNPFTGSNSYKCISPKGFDASYTGGSGNNCQVFFVIKETLTGRVVDKMTVVELKTKCKHLGLKQSGGKSMLQERLKQELGFGGKKKKDIKVKMTKKANKQSKTYKAIQKGLKNKNKKKK
eukprot:424879_1